jgi:hypothetical protein
VPRHMGFELCSLQESMSRLQTAQILCIHVLYYTFSYEQSLQWWFRCMRLQTCFGPVCVWDTTLMTLMYLGWECVRLDSTTRRVSFYASLSGGGLRPSGSSSGSTVGTRIYIRERERYTPNTYRYICTSVHRTRNCKLVGVGSTSIGALSEVWVGGRRDSGSDGHESIRPR